jgi:hypothetical protein
MRTMDHNILILRRQINEEFQERWTHAKHLLRSIGYNPNPEHDQPPVFLYESTYNSMREFVNDV